MIRVVMFDLGRTLVDDSDQPFPHVKEALGVISTFTSGGRPLRSCLVSDFLMPTPPVTPHKTKALFNEYLAILDHTGLRPFFEPVQKRVTLSTHAGVGKPNREIFEKALQRLGAKVPLNECLLVTEDPTHIQAVRQTLDMPTLRFRSSGSTEFDFDDWSQVPMLIANRISAHASANAEAALKVHLAAAYGVDLVSVSAASSAGALKVGAQTWQRISVPGFDNLQDVLVAVPVDGQVTLGANGEIRSVSLERPSGEQVAEVTSYVRSLATHGQIASHAGQRTPIATHEIQTDENGNRKLVRRGFSVAQTQSTHRSGTGSGSGEAPSSRRHS